MDADLSRDADAAEPEIAIGVCVTCRNPADPEGARPGVAFLADLRQVAEVAGESVAIRPVQCFGICDRPCTVSLTGRDRYTYLFGNLDPQTGIPALLELVRVARDAPHGYMLWRERPEALRRTTIARVPPLSWSSDDGRHPR